MKVHKSVPELTLTEDDVELVVEKVQDHTAESWDDVEKQREEIIKKLTEVKETLAQLQLDATQQKEKAQPQQTVQEKTVPVQETVQIIVSG
jgi:ParB-like chromosome segregation protein Spo0J